MVPVMVLEHTMTIPAPHAVAEDVSSASAAPAMVSSCVTVAKVWVAATASTVEAQAIRNGAARNVSPQAVFETTNRHDHEKNPISLADSGRRCRCQGASQRRRRVLAYLRRQHVLKMLYRL
mgnify:CR=1 FL=1